MARNVLVVDDEPAVGRLVERALPDCDVKVVHTGEAALALFRGSCRFELVLADARLPGLSGAQLYDAVLRLDPEQAARFAFITGDAHEPDFRARLVAVGADRSSPSRLAPVTSSPRLPSS